METDPKKVVVVQQWPIPRNIKELRGFLVLAGCYRKFIRYYGIISNPLTDLLKKEGFHWSDKATKAFEDLKNAFTSVSVLALPVSSIQFIIETDACDLGIGAILMQDGHLIAFIRKGLSGKHLTLLVYDKELLALVMAITKWSQYLLGRPFIIRTDQRALKYLLDQKLHTGFQMKWVAKLMHYDFEIEYKRERENKTVDVLSRLPMTEVFF